MRLGVGLLGRRLLRKRQLCLSNAHRAVGRQLVDDCKLTEPQRSTGQRALRNNMRFVGAVLGCRLLRQWWPSPDTRRDMASSCHVSIGLWFARSLRCTAVDHMILWFAFTMQLARLWSI